MRARAYYRGGWSLPLPEDRDQVAERFYRGVLGNNPDHEEALYLLANSCRRRGRHEEGLALSRRLSRLRPWDSWVSYKLASSYSLTGRKDHALDCLARAAALGFRDVKLLLHDRTFDLIRTDSRFHAILTYLRSNP